MKKAAILATVLLGLLPISTAWADVNTDKAVALRKAISVAKIDFCDAEATLKNVLPIGGITPTYLVKLHIDGQRIDGECNRGSGTGDSMLVMVKKLNNQMVVTNHDLFAEFGNQAHQPNTRFVQKIILISPGVIRLITNEYARNDGNCCPTLRYSYDVQLDGMRIIQKRFLGKGEPQWD
ncbi:hypothetical protein [Neisseria sp.]|uniref:hypothetical protein n=1 Tax=Neisseria sp. TaxID=192066 RepID=UPI0026DCBDC4|nr:hypothetical protein [Neisseria sp.]MDO4227750.1 hypothetical protein [Neisseria sp.]